MKNINSTAAAAATLNLLEKHKDIITKELLNLTNYIIESDYRKFIKLDNLKYIDTDMIKAIDITDTAIKPNHWAINFYNDKLELLGSIFVEKTKVKDKERHDILKTVLQEVLL